MKNFVFAITAVALVVSAAAYAGVERFAEKRAMTQDGERTTEPAADPWRLRSRAARDLGADVTAWANSRFAAKSEMAGPAVGDEDRPFLPLRAVETIEFEVISIPRERRMPDYEDAAMPTFYALQLLRDERGNVYQVAVEGDASGTFAVQSVGPLLDRQHGALQKSLNARRLNGLRAPAANPRGREVSEAMKAAPRRVLIPYPFAMDQLFFQHGDDPETAIFESVWTGKTYEGLEGVLLAVDADWARLQGE